jgi:hypothetical protein
VQDHTHPKLEGMARPTLESSFVFDRVEFIDLIISLIVCSMSRAVINLTTSPDSVAEAYMARVHRQ